MTGCKPPLPLRHELLGCNDEDATTMQPTPERPSLVSAIPRPYPGATTRDDVSSFLLDHED